MREDSRQVDESRSTVSRAVRIRVGSPTSTRARRRRLDLDVQVHDEVLGLILLPGFAP
jgi:hypothetical protein